MSPRNQRSKETGEGSQRPAGLGEKARQIIRRVEKSYPHGIHPALVPGIAVEEQRNRYGTDKVVFGITAALIIGFIAWGLTSKDSLITVSGAALAWTLANVGWLFTGLVAVILLFMLFIAVSRYGNIPLGKDDEAPEYSKFSWIAMMFSAGIGIGILFFGPLEPLTYFQSPAPGSATEVVAESPEAAVKALAQTFFHWGIGPWAIYGLVGAAVAYGAFRRGRVPLMSSILTALLGKKRVDGVAGRLVDMFAIVATLFGTAASLGIGASQIGRGVEIVAGIGKLPNAVLILIIALLTAAFITSAVSGVGRGIRWLSNINMTLAMVLAIFIFAVGPTLFILDLLPSAIMEYGQSFFHMLGLGPAYGPEAAAFTGSWTIFYWAWWISWSPFVGIFLAKISRGRTLREFILYVITMPTLVCIVAFAVLGGTAIWMRQQGLGLDANGPSEELFFQVLGNLPLNQITPIIGMILIAIFFVTSADSASMVMGTLSQRGQSEPSKGVTVFWGLAMMGIAVIMLLIGGSDALAGLQNLIVVTAVPFAVILLLMMISFAKDLRSDPLVIRREYAVSALQQAVREGIDEYGDDFALTVQGTKAGEGAGSDFDSHDTSVTEWYQRTDEEGNNVDYDYATGTYADGWTPEDPTTGSLAVLDAGAETSAAVAEPAAMPEVDPDAEPEAAAKQG